MMTALYLGIAIALLILSLAAWRRVSLRYRARRLRRAVIELCEASPDVDDPELRELMDRLVKAVDRENPL